MGVCESNERKENVSCCFLTRFGGAWFRVRLFVRGRLVLLIFEVVDMRFPMLAFDSETRYFPSFPIVC